MSICAELSGVLRHGSPDRTPLTVRSGGRRAAGEGRLSTQTVTVLFTDLVEGVAEHLAELWTRLAADVTQLDPKAKRELEKQLADARADGDDLVERLNDLARRVAAPRTDSLRLAGAAGDAEDLL